MNGIKGIQPPYSLDLLEQMITDYQRLEQRVSELERLKQPPAHYLFKPKGERAFAVGELLLWTVPKDVDGLRLEIVEGGLNFPGSIDTEIQIVNLTQGDINILFSPLVITAGDLHSDETIPHVEIDHTANQVYWRNRLQILVEVAPEDARGIELMLGFV